MFVLRLNNKTFRVISETTSEHKVSAWVIGGFVRDLFLERDSKDIDIVVLGSGIDLAQNVASKLGKEGEAKYFKNF